MTSKDYFTPPEAARELGLPLRTVQNRIRAGIIRAERHGARTWLIPASEVEEWKGKGRLRPWEARKQREAGTDGVRRGRQP